jgi:hypothetical protein
MSGVRTSAAERRVGRDTLIHLFAIAPVKEKNSAKMGVRNSPSDIASSEFLTRNASGSFKLLSANNSRSGNSALCLKARLRQNATVKPISIATIAHHTRGARTFLVENLDAGQRRHIIFMDRDEFLDQSARILLDLRIEDDNPTSITDDDIPF